jgi:Ca-activated chloride channel homolog
VKLILILLLSLQATLTVRTVLVALPVTVTTRGGERITGLTQENFRLYEDGKLQPITLFHHAPGPITLGLIVDHSGSMSDNLPGMTAALNAFSAATQADDELFVVQFNEYVAQPLRALGLDFTNDPRVLAGVTGNAPARGRTALYDGILVGLEQVVQGRRDKRALVVVSDGGDNVSTHTYADVQRLAARSEVVIYAIGLRGTSDERSPKVLKRLVEDTGGVAYFPSSPQGVTAALNDVIRDLREQYTLGFSPESSAGVFHNITVSAGRADGKALRVRTRSGYLDAMDK